MVVPWEEEEQVKSRSMETDSMSKQQKEATTGTEITVEETEKQRRFVSWSPRKNDLGGHGEPLTDWLPTMGDVGMKAKQDKVSSWAPSSSIWSDAPLNPWVPGKALAEASASSWTPGTSWNPGKAEETDESMKIQQDASFPFLPT